MILRALSDVLDSTIGYDSWYLLPFGRGSIKITNNQPYSGSSGFTIDPRYFSNRFDALAQAATTRFTRLINQASPLSADFTGETTPGGAVANGASLDTWLNWVKANYRSNWHPIGTAAMMSKELGGVVDSRNRVYGVSGLRVVDGSILPFQVSSHLMSVLYGLVSHFAFRKVA
jgi:choline dehydrogenase-like flavoprotein